LGKSILLLYSLSSTVNMGQRRPGRGLPGELNQEVMVAYLLRV